MMGELAAIALGAVVGLISGLALGTCFIFLLGCREWEMQLIIVVHSILAMVVMCSWAVPALISQESDS